MKDTSTQTSEINIFAMTPVSSPVNDSGPVTDKHNITSGFASVGTSTVAAPKQTAETTPTKQLRHVSQKHLRYK